jgi:hypothetical protein
MTAIMPVQFQPPPAPPIGDALWQYLLADHSFIAVNVTALVLCLFLVFVVRYRYGRFYKLQREAIDHRKSADARVLAQSQSFEQIVSQQYGITNAHSQQALAKADEALRLNADTLAQVTAMNRTLLRIAERLEQAGGPAA